MIITWNCVAFLPPFVARAVMLRQALVPPGMVAMPRWPPLPLIELGDEPTRSHELEVDRFPAPHMSTEDAASGRWAVLAGINALNVGLER